MSGEIPISIQTPEARGALTPREGLEKFLETEKQGSIKGQALADRARSEVLENRMRRFTNKHEANPDLPISREEYLTMTQYAAFSETYRTRRFGENGTEYALAFTDSRVIFDRYVEAQLPPKYDEQEQESSYIHAQAALEADLLEVNANKSRQGK